jgi:hypothetical protein
MKLVLLDGLFGEGDNLLFGLSLILWKGHPLANDFAACLVVFFHVRGSLAYFSERRPSSRPRPPWQHQHDHDPRLISLDEPASIKPNIDQPAK